jgi:hypothetical protein
MVDRVNGMIETEVVGLLKEQGQNVVFINVDQEFESHRFCENVPDPLGSNNNQVWFTELNTRLVAKEDFKPQKSLELQPDFGVKEAIGNSPAASLLLPSKLQEMASFHPKPQALRVIADRVLWHILKFAEESNTEM